MPFESGSFALAMFRMPKKLPENSLELFASRQAGLLDQIKDEPVMGWVSGRHLLESRIDEETAICGGHLHMCLRTAERKIPATLLKAICRREELIYMQANNTVSVPSKVRKQIKAEAVEKNLLKMPPSITGVPMVIDQAAGMLYLGCASQAQIDNFLALFLKTTEIEPLPFNIDYIAVHSCKCDPTSLHTLSFTDKSANEDDPMPGRDFLTWLWYFSEMEGGTVKLDKYGEFALAIEGPLTFAYSAEAKGSGETSVKKGCPLRSAEAKAALEVGKKLKKAKILLVRGEERWTGSFDADKFVFSGLSLPDGEEMEHSSRFAERIEFLHMFQMAMQEYVKTFIESASGKEFKSLEKKIIKWASERASY
ncbi:MAG: hypothetical protein A2X49_12100 [Lentisphaerae bacterium GWF2_52_8]|nr:MAG: hypothetical protein A2X49_12100 [Lentisphaerae bacterium GWF2_52_8]